jgi:hypothetical protein
MIAEETELAIRDNALRHTKIYSNKNILLYFKMRMTAIADLNLADAIAERTLEPNIARNCRPCRIFPKNCNISQTNRNGSRRLNCLRS